MCRNGLNHSWHRLGNYFNALTFVVLLFILSPSTDALAEDDKPLEIVTAEQVSGWIVELGSPSVDTRELAAQELYRSGKQSLEFLKRTASESNDVEIKSRCLALLNAIEQDDLGKRVYQFLRDPDATKTYGMKSWTSFSKIIGPGRLSKRLFKEIIDTHPEFAEADLEDPVLLRTETERISREILIASRMGEVNRLGDVVTLMFACVQMKVNIPRDVEQTTTTLTRRTPFPQEVQSLPLGTPLRSLFREWIKTASSEPEMVMITCMELGIDDCKSIAKKQLEDKQAGSDLYEISMSCLMRFGTRDDLPTLDRWIADDRGLKPSYQIATNVPMRQIPAPFGVPGQERVERNTPVDPKIQEVQVQYRDLAIAVGFKILGEDVTRHYPRAQWHPYRGFVAATLALPVDDPSQRDAIIARWQEVLKSPSANADAPKAPPIELR